MTDDSFLQTAGPFLEWFKAWPGTTFHPDIEIVDLRAKNAGRGIVAKRDIAADTVLFTIPRSAVLSVATSELASLVPSLAQKDGKDGKNEKDEKDNNEEEEDDSEDDTPHDAWTLLILAMIFEFLRGEKSPWKAYLDVLPAAFETPMFWSADELRALQASPVVDRIGRAEADKMIQTKVLPVIRAHSAVFFPSGTPPLSDSDLVALAHRMGSTILAYSFSLENDDDDDDDEAKAEASDDEMKDGSDNESESESESESGDGWVEDKEDQLPLGMVPMADMLNADAEFNAHINHGTSALTATAVRPIQAGEEILNYYGPLSNGELMRRYGYTTEKHEHFDAVDLPWRLLQQALLPPLGITEKDAEAIVDALDPDDDWEDPIMLDREFEEEEETGRLAPLASPDKVLTELPAQLRRQTRAFIKRAVRQQKKSQSKKDGKGGKGDKDGKEEADEGDIALAAISQALAARLAAYPTTMAADQAELSELQAKEASSPLSSQENRLRMALRVRIGEKRLLAEAAALARAAMEARREKSSKKSSHKSTGPDEQRGSKRQRTR